MALQWLPPQLEKKFNKSHKCFSKQYDFANNELIVIDEAMLSENMADHGGLMASIKAYDLWSKSRNKNAETRLPGLEFLTPKQLLLLGMYLYVCTDMQSLIRTDPKICE